MAVTKSWPWAQFRTVTFWRLRKASVASLVLNTDNADVPGGNLGKKGCDRGPGNSKQIFKEKLGKHMGSPFVERPLYICVVLHFLSEYELTAKKKTRRKKGEENKSTNNQKKSLCNC